MDNLNRRSILHFLLTFIAALGGLFVANSAFAQVPEKEAPLPQVLIIGDSISIGYTKPVIELLKGQAEVQRVPTNAGHTGKGLAELPKWLAASGGEWDVIHFNWGLHDLCYRNPTAKNQGKRDKVDGKITHTPDQYRENLEKIVAILKETDAKLIWASTTPVPEGEAGRKVGDDAIYNAVAAEVMRENDIPINDLHALMADQMKTMAVGPGNVHFKPEGSQRLAKQVVAAIEQALNEEDE